MKNEKRVAQLEKKIVKRGTSKIFKLRDLKDLIVYYDTYVVPYEKGETTEEPPEVDDCLPPDLRKIIDESYANRTEGNEVEQD